MIFEIAYLYSKIWCHVSFWSQISAVVLKLEVTISEVADLITKSTDFWHQDKQVWTCLDLMHYDKKLLLISKMSNFTACSPAFAWLTLFNVSHYENDISNYGLTISLPGNPFIGISISFLSYCKTKCLVTLKKNSKF